MEETVAGSTSELEVNDFGPIVEAKVKLRPLTIFVGPSNTGKSYLAILIYALHRYFCGRGVSRGLLPIRSYPIFDDQRVQGMPQAFFDLLSETMRGLQRDSDASTRSRFILPSPLTDEIRLGLEAGGGALGREIGRCFGLENVAGLVRRGQRNGARILLGNRTPDEPGRLEHVLTLTARGADLRTTIPHELSIQIDATSISQMHDYVRLLLHPERKESEGNVFTGRLLVNLLGDLIRPYIAGVAHLPAYYLPADRTGVMHAHSVVVSALIGSAPTAGLRPATRTPVLSGVLADFLDQLIGIDRPWDPRWRGKKDLGARIEKTVLGGTVRVHRSTATDYPSFAYRPDGWKNDLPLMNASSMVSELAPVVLYLRHTVDSGDVLIIEEPESHLHPAMQVEFTRQLAALVEAGVRVIVTTHSEWLLEEIANIVRRSELPEGERGRGDVALQSHHVGAWLFQPKKRPRGSVVTEIRFDDSGLYPAGFDEVATALHNDWAEMSSRIGDGS